jgi:hypothetical protein
MVPSYDLAVAARLLPTRALEACKAGPLVTVQDHIQ